VDFVHQYITKKWGITVPIKTSNIYQAVNVKYTLCAVDRANEILNGAPSATTYCNHQLATDQIIDTIKVIDAVDRLVKKDLYPGTGGDGEPFKVYLTGMTAGAQFNFAISASGNFTIDWGDGTAVQNITKTDVTFTAYIHTYSAAGNYVVTIGGKATEYNSATNIAAVSFSGGTNAAKITKISGDLGSVFPILNATATGSPRFYNTFNSLTGWTGTIPENLFAGLHGAPVSYMFYGTFYACSGLKGPIPGNLFAGITGAPMEYMFALTFYTCSVLTGPIPENLFAGITGAPAQYMFYATFAVCAKLDGAIPGTLFAGIKGAPETWMFDQVFWGTAVTSIGDGLFNGITGAAKDRSFGYMFYNCTKLTGPSAKSDGQFLYQKWPVTGIGENCYYNAKGLSDYTSIPKAWGGGGP